MSTTRASLLPGLDACACSGRNLDKLIQPAVLAVLADEPLHGYRLVGRLAELPMFGGHSPDTTGVYRFLHTMERGGLVRSAWDLSEAGPVKKLFDLTARGRSCLARWVQTLNDYHEQIGEFLKVLRTVARPARAAACKCRKAAGARPRPARKRAK